MKDEIKVAVGFLCHVIEKNTGGGLEKEALDNFREQLVELLSERFQDHWFPDKPSQGQGFRCIRVNEVSLRESLISRAASYAGLSYEQLSLPSELTIWIDPKEVCCRFGESQGSYCTLATFKNGLVETHYDQVNYEEIQKKIKEQWEKMKIDICTRKNGSHRPRGFLAGMVTGSSPNFKGGRSFINTATTNNYILSSGQHSTGTTSSNLSNPHHHHHHSHHHSHSSGHGGHAHHHNAHSHQGGHHGGGGLHHSSTHTPSPAAVSWYNSVNSSNNAAPQDMFSSSPPNHFAMYGLAKFSPPKYGYGSPSKWNPPAPPTSLSHPSGGYGSPIPPGKGDKYHWFSNNKATIKA